MTQDPTIDGRVIDVKLSRRLGFWGGLKKQIVIFAHS